MMADASTEHRHICLLRNLTISSTRERSCLPAGNGRSLTASQGTLWSRSDSFCSWNQIGFDPRIDAWTLGFVRSTRQCRKFPPQFGATPCLGLGTARMFVDSLFRSGYFPS